MAPSDTCSTTAVDGSADEFAPSSSSYTSKTRAQIAAEKALGLARIQTFISNPATSVISLSLDSKSTVTSRLHAAQASIAAFDAAFQKNDGGLKSK